MVPKGEDSQQHEQTTYYSPIPPYHQPPPPPPPPPPDQYYMLLPYHPRRRHNRHLKSCLTCCLSLLLISLALFFLWPSDPKLEVVRLRLNHVSLSTSHILSLDISMSVTLRVRNRDFYSLNYTSVVVAIGYRDRTLGLVKSDGGFVKARASSYVDAELTLNGIQVLHDAFYLLEDLAKGVIPFDTITEVRGDLGLFFFTIPIKAKVSCEVYVNTRNETIMRQDCYPE